MKLFDYTQASNALELFIEAFGDPGEPEPFGKGYVYTWKIQTREGIEEI